MDIAAVALPCSATFSRCGRLPHGIRQQPTSIPLLQPSDQYAKSWWASGQLLSCPSHPDAHRPACSSARVGLPAGLPGSFRTVHLVFALSAIPPSFRRSHGPSRHAAGRPGKSQGRTLAYTTVFVVALNTMSGVASVPRNQVRAALCFGASRWQIFFLVTIPATLSYMITGMRLAMGNCFQTVVAAELVASDSGLGYLIFSARRFMQTEVAYVGIAILGTIGILTDLMFQFATKRLLSQYESRPQS